MLFSSQYPVQPFVATSEFVATSLLWANNTLQLTSWDAATWQPGGVQWIQLQAMQPTTHWFVDDDGFLSGFGVEFAPFAIGVWTTAAGSGKTLAPVAQVNGTMVIVANARAPGRGAMYALTQTIPSGGTLVLALSAGSRTLRVLTLDKAVVTISVGADDTLYGLVVDTSLAAPLVVAIDVISGACTPIGMLAKGTYNDYSPSVSSVMVDGIMYVMTSCQDAPFADLYPCLSGIDVNSRATGMVPLQDVPAWGNATMYVSVITPQ